MGVDSKGVIMTLQEYLGAEFQVTAITSEDGKISFNVKREGFEYITISYHPKQLPSLVNLIGQTIETKYSSWKFLQELK
jgi:hypothetical protein